MRAGVIAAGWGRRLGGGPKALTRVAGRTLIDLVIEGLIDAGVQGITCIVNEHGTAVRDHVERAWPSLDVDWIVRTTPTSMHSFLLVLERLQAAGGGDCLLTTVDAIGRPGTTRQFVEAASRVGGALVLGVTDVIDDEKPLYAVPADGAAGGNAPFRVARLSSEAGASAFVTAGYYWASPAILEEKERALAGGLTALRQFLDLVVHAGWTCWAVPLPPVIDVDRPEDVVAAESLRRG